MADELTPITGDTSSDIPDDAARAPDGPVNPPEQAAPPDTRDATSRASADVAGATPDEPAEDDAGPSATQAVSDTTFTDPYAAPSDPHEGAVPPGYDWPTHGGYLGCLLGLTAACALSGFLGGTWFAILAAPSWVKLLITLVVAVAAFVGLGRLGWALGKRYYREYPQPVRGMAASRFSGDNADAASRDE